MSLAVEVLHPVVVEHAEGKPRIRVDLLRILLHVRLLLHALELPEEKDGGVLDMVLPALLLRGLGLLLDNMREDRVIDG